MAGQQRCGCISHQLMLLLVLRHGHPASTQELLLQGEALALQPGTGA